MKSAATPSVAAEGRAAEEGNNRNAILASALTPVQPTPVTPHTAIPGSEPKPGGAM